MVPEAPRKTTRSNRRAPELHTTLTLPRAGLVLLPTTRNTHILDDAHTVQHIIMTNTTATVYALEATQGGVGPHFVGDPPTTTAKTAHSALGSKRMGDPPALTADVDPHRNSTQK